MMQYDGDLLLPKNFLVPPPEISKTSGEYLVHNGLATFACSETQKFGHVTFFWNGNRSGYFDAKLETYLEVGQGAGRGVGRARMQGSAGALSCARARGAHRPCRAHRAHHGAARCQCWAVLAHAAPAASSDRRGAHCMRSLLLTRACCRCCRCACAPRPDPV